MMKILLIFSSS